MMNSRIGDWEWELEAEGNLLCLGVVEVLFDQQRHLIVKPYGLPLLHRAAQELGIKRCWFHKTHYDVPKRVMPKLLEHIESWGNDGFFRQVKPREILKEIKHDATTEQDSESSVGPRRTV